MTELSPHARRLLRAGRRDFSPSEEQLRSTHRALRASLAMPAPREPGQPHPPATDQPPMAVDKPAFEVAGLGGAGTKLLVGGLIIAGAAAVFQGLRDRGSEAVPRALPPAATARETSVDPAPVVSEAGKDKPARPVVERAPARVAEAVAEPGPRMAKPRRREAVSKQRGKRRAKAKKPRGRESNSPPSVAPAKRARPVVEPTQVRDSSRSLQPAMGLGHGLAREVAMVRMARAAMERGDAHRVIDIADRYEAAFPAGALYQEQLALRALALCELGNKAAARRVQRRLTALAPGSPHLARITHACR